MINKTCICWQKGTLTLTVLYRWDTGFLTRRDLAGKNPVQIGTHSTNRNR